MAPLLCRVSAYDESVTTGCIGFLSYVGAMCDYAIAVTYLPQSVDVTLVVMRWLVNAAAVEGHSIQIRAITRKIIDIGRITGILS